MWKIVPEVLWVFLMIPGWILFINLRKSIIKDAIYTRTNKSASSQAWKCEVLYRRAHIQLYIHIQIRTYSQSKLPSTKEDLNVEPENFFPVTFCQRRMSNIRNRNLMEHYSFATVFLPRSISELLEELGLSQTRFPSSISRCLIRIHVKPSRQSSRTTFRFQYCGTLELSVNTWQTSLDLFVLTN